MSLNKLYNHLSVCIIHKGQNKIDFRTESVCIAIYFENLLVFHYHVLQPKSVTGWQWI